MAGQPTKQYVDQQLTQQLKCHFRPVSQWLATVTVDENWLQRWPANSHKA